MLYLLWGLINIALLLFFIVICFRATKLIRERLGLIFAIVFVFGLLSFMGHSNRDDNYEPNLNQIRTWDFFAEDSLDASTRSIIHVDLQKTLISKYVLGIKYGTDISGRENVPISAWSSTEGWILGTNWKSTMILVNRSVDANRFDYSVNGVVEWKLLGATIYSEFKEYRGTIM